MRTTQTLTVISIPGLAANSLGSYLASLGLLRVLASRWPGVRVAWDSGYLRVVGGPDSIDSLLDTVDDMAAGKRWTSYDRGWYDAQKKSTKLESATPLALWQSMADESELENLAAHIVPTLQLNTTGAKSPLSFNSLLGSGGNAGRRNFSVGWRKAVATLAEAKASHRRDELRALLLGEPIAWREKKLNAGSWFSDANELYNSGQSASREGAVSPWAMGLACEGLIFFAGAASRRLGSQASTQGAFPFVTVRAVAPSSVGGAGHDLAEVWAPIWRRPMALREVTTLFLRGRAEMRGRGASTPAAFAVAIMRRGFDAGITEFQRFVLGRTTSSNTFESRFEGRICIHAGGRLERTTATALERLLGLVEQLPSDRREGKRWRFIGLRGKLEAAIVSLATSPQDPEAARAAVDAAVYALDRVDRNRAFRSAGVSWVPLPAEWAQALLGNMMPSLEARLALALATSFPKKWPFTLYRFGVEHGRGRHFVHVETRPARWVWGPGPLSAVLSDVLMRRILDWEKAEETGDDYETRAWVTASSDDIDKWLANLVDENLLRRWLSRFALFDWLFIPPEIRVITKTPSTPCTSTAQMLLLGLLQPLFDGRAVYRSGNAPASNILSNDGGARTPSAARALSSLIWGRNAAGALRCARSRYAMADVPLALTCVPYRIADPERFLASALFPLQDQDRSTLLDRWLKPQRNHCEVPDA